jgi:hypothetical protein
VVFDTYKRLQAPEELAEWLPSLSASSIFYHFIDARRRLPEGVDDFRYWLSDFGDRYQNLCQELSRLDPYFETLTGLRSKLAQTFQQYSQVSSQ